MELAVVVVEVAAAFSAVRLFLFVLSLAATIPSQGRY